MQKIAQGLSVKHVDIPNDIASIIQMISLSAESSIDISSYAPGRRRIWFNLEPHLGRHGKYYKRPKLPQEVVSWLNEVLPFKYDLGLISNSESIAAGIHLHRDAAYADYEAWGINIKGNSTFIYEEGYPEFRWSKDRLEPKQHKLELVPGTIIQFNCKNRHSAQPEANRVAMQLWKLKNNVMGKVK